MNIPDLASSSTSEANPAKRKRHAENEFKAAPKKRRCQKASQAKFRRNRACEFDKLLEFIAANGRFTFLDSFFHFRKPAGSKRLLDVIKRNPLPISEIDFYILTNALFEFMNYISSKPASTKALELLTCNYATRPRKKRNSTSFDTPTMRNAQTQRAKRNKKSQLLKTIRNKLLAFPKNIFEFVKENGIVVNIFHFMEKHLDSLIEKIRALSQSSHLEEEMVTDAFESKNEYPENKLTGELPELETETEDGEYDLLPEMTSATGLRDNLPTSNDYTYNFETKHFASQRTAAGNTLKQHEQMSSLTPSIIPLPIPPANLAELQTPYRYCRSSLLPYNNIYRQQSSALFFGKSNPENELAVSSSHLGEQTSSTLTFTYNNDNQTS